jgi:hypothetical protein
MTMKIVCRTLVALAFALAIASTAEAVDLTTPPMFVIAPNITHCMAVNVGKVTRNVTFTVVNTTVHSSSSSGPIAVAPGDVADWPVSPSVNSFMYCKITTDAAKTAIRASYCVLQGVTSCSGTVQAE